MKILHPKYLIQTKDDFETLIDYLHKCDLFALDTETNGVFDIFGVSLVGISFGFDLFACYIPLAHLEGEQLPIDYVLESLEPILVDETKEKIYHNRVFDEMVISRYGIDVKGRSHDTVVMAHLYNENHPTKKLKLITNDYLGYTMQTYEEVINSAPRKRGEKKDYNFAKVPVENALLYAADDAYMTYKLFKFFKPRLEEQKVWSAYEFIEAPLQRVVRKMKVRGVPIDLEAIKRADEHFPKLMEQIEADIYKGAGEVFNIDSGKQLGPILFEKLNIGSKIKRTKSGQYATDAKTLELYTRYPIVESVLRLKKIKKTHGTFVKGLEKFILEDGKVHCNFQSTGTDTGRFSSSEPNLQNQQGDEIEDIKIRDFFVPSQGCKLIVADYSQIELRLIAHFSKDKNMIEAFLSDRDFHDETSRKMLSIQGTPITDEEKVTPRQRFNSKKLNFGIPYGRGDKSVSEMLGVEQRCAHWQTWNPKLKVWEYKDSKAKKVFTKPQEPCHNCGKCFITDWFAAFPTVLDFRERVLEFARHYGYVRTLSGRKRRLTEINSNDFMKRSHAERQAFNTKIQGSAGDILKLAMVALEPELEILDAHILMTVHDELVMEAPEEKAKEVVAIAKEIMENPFNGTNPLILPMIVEPQICDRWSQGK